MSAATVLLIVLLIPTAAFALLWTIVIFRVIHGKFAYPTMRAGIELAKANPPKGRACVLIPAHNEEDVIADLINSLKEQDYTDAHFVLVLDRCTDRTDEIATELTAGDDRFTIYRNSDCRDGWAGKVNALWNAVNDVQETKDADYLLFTDADTIHHPSCITASLAMLEHRDVDLLSLYTTLTVERWYERLVQPVCAVELIRLYPIHSANARDLKKRRPFANGQFMLFRAEAYRAVGGHASVQEDLLEDIAFARVMRDKERTSGVLISDGIVRTQMYRNWKNFRVGWKRIFMESVRLKPRRLRRYAVQSRVMAVCAPVCALVCLVCGLIFGSGAGFAGDLAVWLPTYGFALWCITLLLVYAMGGWGAHLFFTHPLGAWHMSAILLEAADDLESRTPVKWGGREYVLEPKY